MYTVKESLICPQNTWRTTSNDQTSACCTKPPTNLVTNGSCGSYTKSGTTKYGQTLNASTCAYVDGALISQNCVCKDSTINKNVTPTCPGTNPATYINAKVCASATVNYPLVPTNVKPCNTTQTVTPYLTAGSCQTANYVWGIGSASYNRPFDAGAGLNNKGDACAAGSPAAPCIVKSGSDSALYDGCTCDRINTTCTTAP